MKGKSKTQSHTSLDTTALTACSYLLLYLSVEQIMKRGSERIQIHCILGTQAGITTNRSRLVTIAHTLQVMTCITNFYLEYRFEWHVKLQEEWQMNTAEHPVPMQGSSLRLWYLKLLKLYSKIFTMTSPSL